jgi:hypothetical protein
VRPSEKPADVARVLLSRLPANQPADIEAVARALKLRVRDISSTGFVGAMFPTEEGVGGLICVAKSRESGRRRFTIAHEIGHYMLLDKSVAPSFCSLKDVGKWRRDRSTERAADIFATELLLPEQEVRPLISKQGVQLSTAELIKDTYNVSLTAAAFRCVELTTDQCAVVVTVHGVVKHVKPSASWRYRIPTGRPPGRYTIARELFHDPSMVAFGGVVSARDWASEKKYTDLDVRFWEESINQIRYSTILSFLTVLNDLPRYDDIDELVRLEDSLNAR